MDRDANKAPKRSRLGNMLCSMLALGLASCSPGLFTGPSLALEVQSAVATGNINVQLIDNTAVLTGHVDSLYDSIAAARAA